MRSARDRCDERGPARRAAWGVGVHTIEAAWRGAGVPGIQMMDVTLKCPSCESRLPVAVEGTAEQITCGRCGRAISLAFTQALRGDRAVDVCPVCEGADFYIRKDFDPKLGVAVVIIGVLVSAGFYGFGMDLVAYGVLAGVVLLDLVIYQRLGDVTVCYRCHAEFRGAYRRTASGVRPPYR